MAYIKDKIPLITLIIVTRNERDFLKKSLQSLLIQSYPKELTEIIIVDGMSTDGTREALLENRDNIGSNGTNIKMLDNPNLILASGWNIAIKNASGDIVCRIDAHSELYPDYIEIGVNELLKRKTDRVACIGGILENVGKGKVGSAIADLFSSRFGVGNSPFRIGLTEPKYTDTAVFGLYWKSIFEEIGYFNESLARNQDIDLHDRILKKGYKLLTHPGMKATYHVRNSFSGLIKKAFKDGFWVVASGRAYMRHKIPLYFVLYLILIFAILLIGQNNRFLAIKVLISTPLIAYIALCIFFSFKDGKKVGKVLLLFLFPLFHISYGLGSLTAIVERIFHKKS